MTRPLRSNFEAGSVREALRRAQWKALGLTDADMEKPKIAVVNSSSELAICFSHLDGIAAVVKEAIRAAAACRSRCAPRRRATSSSAPAARRLHPALARPHRERHGDRRRGRAARRDDLPVLLRQDPARALMAAGRFNIPTILVICGYQPCGELDGEHVDIEDVFLGAVQIAVRQARRRAGCAPWPTTRSAAPACAPAWRPRTRCTSLSRRSGWRCPAARRCAPTARRCSTTRAARASGSSRWCSRTSSRATILTPGAFRNAVAAVLAVSGSINCIKHLQAAAVEAGLDIDVYGLFNELGGDVPVLSAVRPNGEDSIEEFEDAGGAHALLKQLEPRARHERDDGHRRHRRREPRQRGGPRRGSHSPARSRVLGRAGDRHPARLARARERDPQARGARGRRRSRSPGRAMVFDDGARGDAAIQAARCSPATCSSRAAWASRAGRGWRGRRRWSYSRSTPPVCRTRWPSSPTASFRACAKGLTVAEVSPESAVGGPIALVQNGDASHRCRPARLELEVPAAELARRRERSATPRSARARLSLHLPAHRPANVHWRRTRRERLTRVAPHSSAALSL